MSKFFINRPIVAMVIAILMVIIGAVTITSLPVAQFPNIAPPEVQIQATYVGADAETLEQSVATPIEQQMSGVDNMNYMYSLNATANGQTTMIIDFDVKTDPNTDLILAQMRETQAASQLPADVTNYGITVQKSVTSPLMLISLYSPHGTYDAQFLANYAYINLHDQVTRAPGIGNVQIFGAGEYAMRLWVKPDQLAKLGITVTDIINTIQAQNTVNPAGQVGGTCRHRVRLLEASRTERTEMAANEALELATEHSDPTLLAQVAPAVCYALWGTGRRDLRSRVAVSAIRASKSAGDPRLETTQLGPLITEADAVRVLASAREAIVHGARMVVGGDREGALLAPLIVSDVPPESSLAREELFGPAVAITTVSSFDEAIAQVNANRYGLAAGIFTRDVSTALRFAHEAEYGVVQINSTPTWRADMMPYGGLKDSGFGREGPRYALAEMTEVKTVVFHGGMRQA